MIITNDLSVLKFQTSYDYHYFPVTIENIENFNDDDVSEFLSNIIVPATDGIDTDGYPTVFRNYASNPYPH